MWRSVHGIVGAVSSLGLLALALSGVILAYAPMVTPSAGQVSLGHVLERLNTSYPGIEIDHIERTHMGAVLVHHYADGARREELFDANNGQLMAKPKQGNVTSFAQSLHREFFLGRPGRIISGILGLVMAVMCLSGAFLLVRRAGGFRALLKPVTGQKLARYHVICGQITFLPLLVLSLTAVWMSLITFQIIPSDAGRLGRLPDSTKVDVPPLASELAIFDQHRLDSVAKLTFPIPGDWFDVYILETAGDRLVIDQANGAVLQSHALPLAYQLNRLFYRLHSGEGMRIWAGILALSGLGVPVFVFTGGVLLARRLRKPRSRHLDQPVMILVGSENGSTWAFANSLLAGLGRAGLKAGVADLNMLAKIGPHTRTLLVLTATYGDGTAPMNAVRSLASVGTLTRDMDYAVLGFGDRQFANFCAFAEILDKAFAQHLSQSLLPLTRIHQQSMQDFQRWVALLAEKLDASIEPVPIKPPQKLRALVVEHIDQFPDKLGKTALIRLKRASGKALKFRAGDLVEVFPPDTEISRLYSIASPPDRSVLDLYIREHENGQCSPILCNLEPGSALPYRFKAHDSFRAPRSGSIIMIAVGSGIAPFMSMIGAEKRKERVSLYWGLRNPSEHFPFKDRLSRWVDESGLAFYPAFSGQMPKIYVTDLLAQHADDIRQQMAQGASIMFCGSRSASQSVSQTLSTILADTPLTLERLRAERRYREDIF